MNLKSTPLNLVQRKKQWLFNGLLVFGLLLFSIQTQAQQCTGNVTLTSNSGTITDGPGNYQNNQRCTWLLQPIGAQEFTISFSQFLINPNDTLFIYNGSDSTGTLIARLNGFTAPAARNVVANSIFVKFKTNNNAVLPGFSLDYEASSCSTPTITASGPLTIPAGQSVTLSAPAGAERYIWSNGDSVQTITIRAGGTFSVRTIIAGCTSLASASVTTTLATCSGNLTLTSANGAITDGPGNYTNNNNCTWLIQSPGAASYRLTFTQFTINNNDTLKIYNGIDTTGTLVGRYTGNTNPGAIIVNGSSVFVKFRTNAAGVGAGFAMAFNSSACSAPAITASGPLAIPAGQTLTLTTAQVADHYLWSNGDTTQSIAIQTAGTYTLRTVTSGCTSLASNAIVTTLVSCAGNVVLNSVSGTISDGPGQYDNNSNCTWLIQPTGATSITLNFTGNFNLEANNDLLRIYQGTDTTGTLVATLTGTATPQSVRVFGGAMFVRLTTNANTTRAGFVANYSITTCTFAPVPSITPADSFNLLNTPSRELTASEAPAGMSYLWSTGDTTRSITVTTPGNYSVRIINGACTTAQSNVVIVTNIIPQCSGNVTLISVTGTVTEGQGQYTNNRRCTWLINPPGATSININFLEMDMESCCDFVDIFDGPDSTFTRIGRFTGATIPAAVTVPGGVAWVRFTSDISLVGAGFTFNYTGVVCPTTPATPTVTPAGPIDLNTVSSAVLTSSEAPSGARYLWSTGDTTRSITITTIGNYSVRLINGTCTSRASNVVVANLNIPQCSGNTTLTSLSGAITDGQGIYSNSQRCTWLVSPAGANNIVFNFLSFNTEAGWDFVEIFEGIDSTGISLGRFSGVNLPPSITVSGGNAWVRFTTDLSQTREGFVLNYLGVICPNAPAIPNITADGPTTFRTGGSVVLRTTPIAGVSYIWSNGSTADTLSVTTTGLYRVRAVGNGCTSSFSAPVGVSVLTGCNGITTLNTTTGSITDGPGNYENNANCKFLVQIPGATYIDFSFSQFNTQANFDIVRIYQGTDSLGTLVGTFSGNAIPAGVTVLGGSAFIQFISNGFTVNPGYTIDYTSGTCVVPVTPTILTPNGTFFRTGGSVVLRTTPTAGVTYLWNNGSTADSLRVTAAGSYTVRVISNGCTSLRSVPVVVTELTGCNGLTTFNTSTGSITDGPNNYENNANCKFLIQIPGATFIDFSFSQFNTQANFDILRIYQGTDSTGTLIGTFSGAAIPSGVTVVGGSAFVQFISNGFTVNTGYVLNYVSGNCTLPATPTITASGPLELPVTGGSVTLSAPNVIGARYLWSTGDTTRSITVTGEGTYSVRTVVNGCSSAISQGVVVTVPQCNGNYTATALTGTISEGQGVYTNFMRCSWLIAPANANVLSLQFLAIDMESCCDFVDIFDGPDSTFTRIGRYTGTTIPARIDVPSGIAWIRFTTDVSQTGQGFTLNYTGSICPAPPTPVLNTNRSPNISFGDTVVISAPDSVGYAYLWSNGATTSSIRVATAGSYTVRIIANGCTTRASNPIVVGVSNCSGFTRLTSPSGTIGDGPGVYTDNMNCSWLLNRPGATNIRISFSQFNTEQGSDIIRIYRGADSLSPLVATYSGANIPAVLNVPSDNVFILFTTNGATTRAGFTLNYVITGGCLPPPTPSITANGPIEFCQGGSVVLSAPAGYQAYLWSNGATTQSITVTEPNNYTVRVTENSCQSASSEAVTVSLTTNPAGPTITASGSLAICEGNTVTLSVPTASGYIWSNNATTQSITVTTPGVYFVRSITGTCTTLPSRPVQVTLATPPARPALGYYLRDSLRSTVVAARYEWRFQGNIIAPTTRTIRIIGDGLYSVVAIDAQGCRSAISTEFLVTSLKTALANDIVLYPNPASDKITIGSKGSTLKSVAIITLEGKKVVSQYVSGTEVQLPINLPAGVYMVNIQTSLGTHHERLVIK